VALPAANSAVMSRPRFYVVAGKAANERTDQRSRADEMQ